MKKNKKNKLINIIFGIFLFSFIIIYFSEVTGYYEYKKYQKTSLTSEQIKKYEEDIKNGVEVNLNEYLIKNERKYNNKLSVLASKLSNGISKIVKNGVEYSFKYISKLIEE